MPDRHIPSPARATLAALATVLLLAAAGPRTAGATAFRPGPSTDLDVGNGPRSIATADLNGDGLADLVVGNEGGVGISVLIGLPGGGFAPHVDYATGAVPGQVVIADFDGDGKLDVAVGHYDENTIVILRGTGMGTFTTGVTLDTAPHPEGLCAADLDHDGRIDLSTCGYYSTETGVASVFLNTTTGGVLGFGARADYDCGGWPNSIEAGNFGDFGFPSLVTGNYSGASVSILHNDGTGHFVGREDLPTPPHTYMAAVGNLYDWSERDQIVTANADSASVTLWYYVANPAGWVRKDYPAVSRPSYVELADADGDGSPDVVVSDYVANVISVFRCVPYQPALQPRVDVPTSANPYAVVVAHLGGDLKPDLVSASRTGQSVRCIRGLPEAGWAQGDTIPAFSAPNQNGDLVRLDDGQGKRWTLLDLCSAWCGPCNQMAQHTQATYLSLAGSSGFQFEYLTMLNDGPVAGVASTQTDAQNWATAHHITRPVLHSNGIPGGGVQGIAAQSELWATPTLRLVGPDGVIRWLHTGALDESTLVRVVANAAGIPMPAVQSNSSVAIHAGTATVTYGAQVASSPWDSTAWTPQFPFVLPPGSFGENVTVDFSMVRDLDHGKEDWYVALRYWPWPGLADQALPTQHPWQVTLSNLVLDPNPRTLPPGAVAHVAVQDTFQNAALLPVTVPVTWNGSTLDLGAVTPGMLAGQPPLRTVEWVCTMNFPTPAAGVPGHRTEPVLALRAPWPNPVANATHLAWTQTRAAKTTVTIYDVGGRRVRAVADAALAAGPHGVEWDLTDAGGRRVGAGLYFVRLDVAGEGSRTTRLTVVN
jgi:hypothetical protein